MRITKSKTMLLLIIIMIPLLALYGCGGEDNDEEMAEESPGEEEELDEEEEPGEEEELDEEEEPGDEDENGDQEQETGEDRDLESIFGAMDYPSNFSYEMTMESENMESFTTRLWIMDELFRSEGEWEGQTFISIQDGEYYYMLDPDAMTAMRFPADQETPMEEDGADEPRADEFMIEEDWDRLTYHEDEEINGVATYVVSDSYDEVELRMWIHQEYGIPMRIESTGPDPEDNYVMEVSNLQVGEVTEEDFEIPEDYEVMDFGN